MSANSSLDDHGSFALPVAAQVSVSGGVAWVGLIARILHERSLGLNIQY